jgi:hypothetical protein
MQSNLLILLVLSAFASVSPLLTTMRRFLVRGFPRGPMRGIMSRHFSLTSTLENDGNKLKKLRQLMVEMKVNAVVVPSDDPHLSE